MRIDCHKQYKNKERFIKITHEGYYYNGVIFMRGKRAGRETIEALIQEIETTGSIPYLKLYGAFSCVVQYPNDRIVAFTDNSNMHCFYWNQTEIGSDFLDMIYGRGFSLDAEAICEQIVLGSIFEGKTAFKEVRVSRFDKYYMIENGSIIEKNKGIGDIDGDSTIKDPIDFFADIAYALSGKKVAAALTGGYDSRMVVACLYKKLNLDLFISGDRAQDLDIVYSKKVAKALNRPLEIISTPKVEYTEAFLKDLLFKADGSQPCFSESSWRIRNFYEDRKKRQYDIILTGDGGPRHKSWYWIQDFPFYHKKKTDLQRFYNQRIRLYGKRPGYLSDRLIREYEILEPRIIDSMKSYCKSTNTESYDSLGFHVFGNDLQKGYNISSLLYAPLWEFDLVRYSYHLPRSQRGFYNLMRKLTTKTAPAAARIATNYGTTASSEPGYMVRDFFVQITDLCQKAMRLFGRKVLNKTLFVGNVEIPDSVFELKKLEVAKAVLDWAKKEEIIGTTVTMDEIPEVILERLLYFYWLNRYSCGMETID